MGSNTPASKRRRNLAEGLELGTKYLIVRETHSGTRYFYTGEGEDRFRRWTRNPELAKKYNSPEHYKFDIEHAAAWAGKHSEVAVVKYALTVVVLVKSIIDRSDAPVVVK